MTMMKSLLTVALFLSGWLAHGAHFREGVYQRSYPAEEDVAFTEEGQTMEFMQPRTTVEIPAAYGKLAGVTGGGSSATLWFEASDGSIRNISVTREQLVLVRRKGELKAVRLR